MTGPDATTASGVDRAYGGALDVDATLGRATLRTSRFDTDLFALDHLEVAGTVELRARPSAGVLICQAPAGDTRVRQGDDWVTLGTGEPVLAAAGMSWEVRATDTWLRLVFIRAAVLARLADGVHVSSAPTQSGLRPGRVVPTLAGVWDRSVDYVTGIARSEVSGAEVMAETCARVLGAAALLCFPRTAAHQTPEGLDSAAPEHLRVALAFVADNAREDVGIQEIADAVHLSPRAVQYLFRKHVDMTPTEYLRRVRLHGAHRDLVACDPAVTNVGDVAAAWRFGHTGRFAAAYREAFGNSPHVVLRR